MNATRLTIESKKRAGPFEVVSGADFAFSEGDAIDAQVVVQNPNISLYCLDPQHQRALFVETPDDVDLSQAPFYFQAQYENALGLYAVPYETLHRLANDIKLDSERLILIYSVGRCGSTLLSSAFSQIENLVSMSEPDVFTQLVAIREWDGSRDAEVYQLLQSCTKLLCKVEAHSSAPVAWAIKFRSFGIEIADLMFQCFPKTKTIFLYRDAETWWDSNYRAFIQSYIRTNEYLDMTEEWLGPLVPLVAKHAFEKGAFFSLLQVGMLMWLSVMERYMALYEQGVPMLAVRFEDLKVSPHQVIQQIFNYCNIKTSQLGNVFDAMENDSQAGTVLSQEKLRHIQANVTDADRAEMAQILQARPIIQTASFVLPNTLLLG